MVLEISSEAEFNKEIKVPGLVVVDFFTTWCGPCKMIAPIVEEFSRKYPSVKFIKVDTERNPFSGGLGIRSIPTFFFYVGGNKVEEMMGANPQMLEQKVLQYKTDAVSSFGGSGVTLGTAAPSWDGIGLPPGDNARAARLKAFGALDQKSAGPKAVTDSKPAASIVEIGKISMEVDDDEALAKALQLSQATDKGTQDALDDAEARAAIEAEMASEGNTGDQDWGEDMVPVPVDESILRELGEMGFEEVRARKAIVHGKNIDGALSWLDAHQDDADIDLPYMVRKQDIKAPLTKEELAQRMIQMKEKIVKRRTDREKADKVIQLQQEKERRERGQKLGETQEERDRMMRKREAEKGKREKEAEKKERDRLRAEIARDKELRKANKGVLPSVLGVDGYNPSIVNYNDKSQVLTETKVSTMSDVKAESKVVAVQTSIPIAKKPTTTTTITSKTAVIVDSRAPDIQIDAYIQTIARYRTGGDGGNALRLLITFIKNIVDFPDDPKYRSINPESTAFKSKLANLVGPVSLLKTLGFTKSEEDGKLKLDSFDTMMVQSTLDKLSKAERTYRLMNP